MFFDPLGMFLSGGTKLETILDEDAFKELELKRARIAVLTAVAWQTIPDGIGPAVKNVFHTDLPAMDVPFGLSTGNAIALVLFLISIPKCALLGDYWNSVVEHCEEECVLDLDDLDGENRFDPLGLRQKECVVKEAAKRTINKFTEDNSPTKLHRFADPDGSPRKRLRALEREFERPAAMLIFLYVLEMLASNTCVLRESSMIFDALSSLFIHGMEGDIQLVVEKWLASILEVSGNLKDMLHSVPSLSSKVDAITHLGDKMCNDAGDLGGQLLRDRVEDKFRHLEVFLSGPDGTSGAA
jgi:hypothetical protein